MKSNVKKTLKYYFIEAKKHKLSLFLVLSSAFLGAVVDVIVPWFYKIMFDALVLGPESKAVVATVIGSLVLLAVFISLRWALWRINTFSLIHLEAKVMADLAVKCFAYLHRHSFAYFNNSFVGSFVKKVNWFTRAFEGIFDQLVFNLIPLAVNLVLIIIILSQKNIYLSLGLLLWSIVFLSISWIFAKFKLKYDIVRNEAESSTTAVLADTITNNSNVKLFNGYGRELKNFASKQEDLAGKRKFTWDLNAYFEAVQSFLSVVLEIGIIYAAIVLWQRKILTIGEFVLIQSYVFNIMDKVWGFNRVLKVIYENLSDAEEMTEILELPHEITDVPDAGILKVTAGKIDFRGVDFSYHEERNILSGFDLNIPACQRLAIIGPSGAGKSTVVKLLFRMHEVSGGKVMIDGQDISQVTQESLWHNISLVPQDPLLFHRTIKENIRYGRPEATDKEVISAAKAANCHEFISKLEHGYDTYVGERGIKLSGGERQRVAIARAVLKNAPILVLDEATSSLDSQSEGLIQDALDKLMQNRTVIVIAHRLSTIRKMDRIVVVDNGRVVEDGNHEQLLKDKQGIYHKLWRLQAGGFIE